uniref:Uncharacterized protein n=1 Tax=Angiostrongylus cantonensis TaxID=6313 RepID=A0A0K0D5A2_ANGCA
MPYTVLPWRKQYGICTPPNTTIITTKPFYQEKLMRLSQSHGILKAGDHVKLTIYITSSDDWPLDPAEYSRRRIKLVVENLKIPGYIQPKNKLVIIKGAKPCGLQRDLSQWNSFSTAAIFEGTVNRAINEVINRSMMIKQTESDRNKYKYNYKEKKLTKY